MNSMVDLSSSLFVSQITRGECLPPISVHKILSSGGLFRTSFPTAEENTIWIIIWNVRKSMMDIGSFPMFSHHQSPFCSLLPSGVIKHGWLENPRTERRFLARKITYFYDPFSVAVLDDTGG